MFAYSQCTQELPAVGFCVFFREFQESGGYVPRSSELRHDVSVLRLKFMFLLRALEERLQEQQLPSPELEHILLQLDVGQKKEQHLLSEVDRLKNR